jgi:protein arginine kinase
MNQIASSNASWLPDEASTSNIVLASRTRLARNLEHYPFPNACTSPQRRQVYTKLKSLFDENQPSPLSLLEMEHLNEIERRVLEEKHLISEDLAKNPDSSGVYVSIKDNTSIMINEEDHLRFQSICPGYSLEEAWQRTHALTSHFEQHIAFASDTDFGYLTACPSNVGTGLRLSVMLHLPGLALTEQIKQITKAAEQLALTIRGFNGEGSKPLGYIYQLSNQSTLGETESSLFERLCKAVDRLIVAEENARRLLIRDFKPTISDYVARALGLLRYARVITSEEATNHLFALRFGVFTGLIPFHHLKTIHALIIQIQTAHIQHRTGIQENTLARDSHRADCIRKAMKNF